MPVMMDETPIPTRWAERKSSRPVGWVDNHQTPAESIQIALINNMPDSALEDTELQFFELLDTASGDIPLRLKLYSLPELPRSDRARRHLSRYYSDLEDLWTSLPDGLIITGTEPRRPNLRDEPYWHTLVDVLDWAEYNTTSTVLSCLAAHAGVLHSDGIERRALADKQFGVFDFRRVCEHPLVSRTAERMSIPHSRWNEVREDALTSCGYMIVTKSDGAGVDMFLKRKRKSLFVYFQGHPEYGAHALLKEYQRDIKRFLSQERETYPSVPEGYFDGAATRVLADFRENALAHRQEGLLAVFPETMVAGTLEKTWHTSATRVYSNWLQYVGSRRAGRLALQEVAHAGRRAQRQAMRQPG